MLKVSVIIPVHNSEKTLEACVASLAKQTRQCTEILLIENGSTDKSKQVCIALTKKYTNVLLYTMPRANVSAARNYGIKKAKGELISFVDSDDTVHEKFIEELYNLIVDYEHDLSCCGYQELNNGRATHRMDRIVSNDKYLELIQNYQGFLFNKMYIAKNIKRMRLKFNEAISMSEDLLFNFGYLRGCKSVGYSNKNYYYYNASRETASRAFRDGWFDILTVYDEILEDYPLATDAAKDNFIKQYLFIVEEARMRCRIMRRNFKKVCQNHNISAAKNKCLFRKAMASQYIAWREKLKLILFVKFNIFAQFIKFRRLR